MQRSQQSQERQVVQVIRKGRGLEIRAALASFRGKRFADFRTFATNRAGELVPTPKGITVPLGQLREFEMAVRKLREATTAPPPAP